MGNFFAMIMQQAVHPWSHEARGWEKIPTASCSGGVKIKVRMTAAEFKELAAAADLSEGSSELERLIMRELSKGRFQARVVACGNLMSSISEEKEDDDDDYKLS